MACQASSPAFNFVWGPGAGIIYRKPWETDIRSLTPPPGEVAGPELEMIYAGVSLRLTQAFGSLPFVWGERLGARLPTLAKGKSYKNHMTSIGQIWRTLAIFTKHRETHA